MKFNLLVSNVHFVSVTCDGEILCLMTSQMYSDLLKYFFSLIYTVGYLIKIQFEKRKLSGIKIK